MLLNRPKSAYFATNFINWGWIGFTTAPATATATGVRLSGNLVALTTIAAAQRRFGGYDHGNGYDHDCCGSTTAAITTLAMVTIAAAMATIAEPMGVSEPIPRPPTDWRAPIR